LGSVDSHVQTTSAAEAATSLSATVLGANNESSPDDLKEVTIIINPRSSKPYKIENDQNNSNSNSLSSVSSLGSANPAAVRDSSVISNGGDKSTYTRLKSSTRDDGDGDTKYNLDTVREASSASHEDKEAVTAAAASASPTAAEAVVSEGALACTGGKFVKEECVVCFTDNKEVMLLPCRYANNFLCVLFLSLPF